MDEPRFHPLDYVSVIRRRKWWFIVPLSVSVLTGALLALFLPREYQAWAEIGVAAPTLSPELLKGVSSLDRDERQRAVSQQLLSRTVLERAHAELGPRYELGVLYTMVAGLLSILCLFDALEGPAYESKEEEAEEAAAALPTAA